MIRKPRRLRKKLSKKLFRTATALAPWYKRYVPATLRKAIPKQNRKTLKRWIRNHGKRPGGAPPLAGQWIDYSAWIARNDQLDKQDMERISDHIRSFDRLPFFSILMPIYDTEPDHLRAALDSVVEQLYPDWELIAVDDASPAAQPREVLEDFARQDARIKPLFRSQNGGISACSNTALEAAAGDWIVLMDHDDLLAPQALYMVAEAINRHPDLAIIYSDEDHVDAEGHRSSPYFKPDWDYELFLGQNYINHLGAYRRDLVQQAGGFREGFEGSQDWDLSLRVLETVWPEPKVHHIPHILYHWRQTQQTFSQTFLDKALDAASRAVNEHLERVDQNAQAEPATLSSHLHIKRTLPVPPPLASVIIPTRDRSDLLRCCVEGLLKRTSYEPMEVVLVDNGSSEPEALKLLEELRHLENFRIVEDNMSFNFSRLVNRGVAEASGEVCILLNNDIDVIAPDWLEELVSHACRPDVGAVGAKLYYENDLLQHGGVILGLGGVAGHAQKFLPRNDPGYFYRLNLTHSLSCVTAA